MDIIISSDDKSVLDIFIELAKKLNAKTRVVIKPNEESDFAKELELSLREAKQIQNGELPRRTIAQMIDDK